MNKDNYKNGAEISQKLFEMTGDPRYHNIRVGFEKIQKENTKQSNEEEFEREM